MGDQRAGAGGGGRGEGRGAGGFIAAVRRSVTTGDRAPGGARTAGPLAAGAQARSLAEPPESDQR